MKNTIRLSTATALILGASLIFASAHEFLIKDVLIVHPRVNIDQQARTAEGYLYLENTGNHTVRLISASSPHAERVNIRQRAGSDGQSITSVDLPPGGGAEFVPGGSILLFSGLHDLPGGDEMLPVTLTFESAGDLKIGFMME